MTSGSLITLSGYGESRTEISKSVFIGQAMPVRTQDEAENFIASVRKNAKGAKIVEE